MFRHSLRRVLATLGPRNEPLNDSIKGLSVGLPGLYRLLGPSRVRQLLAAGQLDAIQPGGARGHWFVNRAEAERLLAPIGSKK